MENLSKLITKNISLSRFNFEGFSTSKNWIGYFEANKCKSDINMIHIASMLVYNFFKENWQDFFVLSALFYCDEFKNEAGVDDKYLGIYNLAKQYDLLTRNDIEDAEEYFNLEIPLPAKFLKFCFDTNFILPFSEMVMAMTFGKIIGQQCFLINPKLKIALYPHDDIGFGCIDLGNNPKLLLDFLHYCNQDPDFSSHIDEVWKKA